MKNTQESWEYVEWTLTWIFKKYFEVEKSFWDVIWSQIWKYFPDYFDKKDLFLDDVLSYIVSNWIFWIPQSITEIRSNKYDLNDLYEHIKTIDCMMFDNFVIKVKYNKEESEPKIKFHFVMLKDREKEAIWRDVTVVQLVDSIIK